MYGPYPWMGGKFYELKWLLPMMPVHKYYYEPFFGSGTVLLNKPKAEQEFVNDLDSKLISFWLCLQDEEKMEELKKRCLFTLESSLAYRTFMEKINEDDLSIVDKAYMFLYLIRFGFNSLPNTYRNPLSHDVSKMKNASLSIRTAARKFKKFYERIKDVIFYDYDFADFIKEIRPRDDAFIFLDPPYYNKHQYDRDHRTGEYFGEEEYKKMRELLEKQTEGGTMWMITCDNNNPFFDGMKNTVVRRIERKVCGFLNSRKFVRTKVVMNYKIDEVGRIMNPNKEKVGRVLCI